MPGVGKSIISFFLLLSSLLKPNSNGVADMKQNKSSSQLDIFDLIPPVDKPILKKTKPKKQAMRVFANDEIANSLEMLPKASSFQSLEAYKQFLVDSLPYNAAETRIRRANYIVERFFPEGDFNIPLTYYAAHCSSTSDLQPMVFYHILKAEPIAAKIAEELIWPAVPLGELIGNKSVSLFSVIYLKQDYLHKKICCAHCSIHINCSISALLTIQPYVFSYTTEHSKAFFISLQVNFQNRVYIPLKHIFNSPMHRWLLWDREWMRLQLYNLQDFGIFRKYLKLIRCVNLQSQWIKNSSPSVL